MLRLLLSVPELSYNRFFNMPNCRYFLLTLKPLEALKSPRLYLAAMCLKRISAFVERGI